MTSGIAPGSLIGRFVVEAPIGRGGMGVVYRALDPALNRPVAIKVLAPHLDADSAGMRRLEAEAAAAAALKHPNIATLYEFGQYADQPYLVLEWVEGRTLRSVLEEGRLEPARALAITRHLASALDYAHAQGVIHRDLTPNNVIIGTNDTPTIIDFGLARLVSAATVTNDSTFFGTPRYVAPEQIRGDALDGRADQYSLALLSYEMLAGGPPFAETTLPALLHQQLNIAPAPLSEQNPNLPPRVDPVLARALAKHPAERYPTLSAYAAALVEALAPVDAPPMRAPLPRGWMIAGIALLALLIGGAAYTSAQRTSDPLPVAGLAPNATAARSAEPTTEPAAEPTVEPTSVPTIEATIEPTAAPTPVPPRENGWWPVLGGASSGANALAEPLDPLPVAQRWERNPRTVNTTPFVAGAGKLYFGLNWSRLRALDWETGATAWERDMQAGVIGAPLMYSTPNDALLVVPLSDGRLSGVNLHDGSERWRMADGTLAGTSYEGMVAETSTLYVPTDEGWVYAIEPLDGTIAWSRAFTTTNGISARLTATADRLLVPGGDDVLYALDARGDEAWRTPTDGRMIAAPTMSVDRGIVYVATDRGQLQALNLDSGQRRWVTTVSDAIVGLATDGARVYATTRNGSVYAWPHDRDEIAWSVNTDSTISSAPLTDGNLVIVATQAGEVRFLDANNNGFEASGTRLLLKAPITETPVPAGGWLFVRAGTLYGFGP